MAFDFVALSFSIDHVLPFQIYILIEHT